MSKGLSGETCAQAIRDSIMHGEVVTFQELYARVSAKGDWKEATILQHLMGTIVNLPPARIHWKNLEPILFTRADGRYEMYSPRRHPKVIEG